MTQLEVKVELLAIPVPDYITVTAVKPYASTLEEAYDPKAVYRVDVGDLDERAIEQVIDRWVYDFRENAKRRNETRTNPKAS